MTNLASTALDLLKRLRGEGSKVAPRPEVPESWMQDFNPVMDATPVRRFGAVFVGPGRYFHAESGHFLDANAALIAPETCVECGTDHDDKGHIVGPDFRYMVRVQRPEHLFATKPVYEFTWCRRCLTPAEVEESRQQLFEGMPAQPPQPRKRARRTRTWVQYQSEQPSARRSCRSHTWPASSP